MLDPITPSTSSRNRLHLGSIPAPIRYFVRLTTGARAALQMLFVLFLLFSLNACARANNPRTISSPITKQESGVNSSQKSESEANDIGEPPFSLAIDQAFVREEQLHVKAHLVAKAEFPANRVLVSLVGLREGNIRHEQVQRVSDLLPRERLRAGETIALFFTLPALDLSEYQLRCTWGDELQTLEATQIARAENEKDKPGSTSGSQSALVFTDLEVIEQEASCPAAPCDIVYTLLGTLRNTDQTSISHIELAIGLFWEGEGTVRKALPALLPISENEEKVELSSVTLAPGQEKKIRLAVDRTVPRISGGRFVPLLRVLAYQRAG